MINLMHIDADAGYRRTLEQKLAPDAMTVVASFGRFGDALQALQSGVLPDIVLFALPVENDAREVIEQLRSVAPSVRIIILTENLTLGHLGAAFEAGAAGYLLKQIPPSALAEAIMLVVLGEKVFPTQLADFLVEKRAGPLDATVAERRRMLTPKELQVMQYVKLGYSNKEIAALMGIADMTVRIHLNSAFRKINVENRMQGALWMLEHGDQNISRSAETAGRTRRRS